MDTTIAFHIFHKQNTVIETPCVVTQTPDIALLWNMTLFRENEMAIRLLYTGKRKGVLGTTNAGKKHLHLIMIDHMLPIKLTDLAYPRWLSSSRHSRHLQPHLRGD